ncbi:pRiA4b ORF-3-like protein [Quadrisphaera granulorum]|uniref:PRiA4b ORF-3-like protein n=1 Tax=Quadrisphaera granulorum TaxID=317664 RepID=A0A315ZT26_9ACTN|nr:hypothetical protein [Quadrisphaera granulorum]PWJ48449.1 pRiA4b ORF-3-like protein [Quadrisphaera granulorum]SZE98408.1 pRiA4b ORF-3-like protein [Quadrisphaera granulorum]
MTSPTHLHDRRAEPVTYRLRVDLDRMKPPVWRRLDVRSDLNLEALHLVLQAAFGWENSHLHHFHRYGERGTGQRDLYISDVEFELPDALPEHEVTLDQVLTHPGETLGYTYDLGDDWSHTLKLEKILPFNEDAPPAVLVTGRQPAPFEDGMGPYDEDGELLDEPLQRDFDLDELRDAVVAVFEDDDAAALALFDIDDELIDEIGAIPPDAVAAAARSNPLVVRLRERLGVPVTDSDAAPGADLGSPESWPARLRETLQKRDDKALATLASIHGATLEARELREELVGDDTGTATVVLIAYLSAILDESVPLQEFLRDPQAVADTPGGPRVTAFMQLLAVLGAHGVADLLEIAQTCVDPSVLLTESALLDAAGLATLKEGNQLRLDPNLRAVLLMALSGLVGANDEQVPVS